MSNKGLRMAHFLVRIFILFFLLFIFYLTFPLIGIDFHLFLSKCLLTKSLHFLFSRLGWCGGGLLITFVFSLFDLELAKMMDPSVSEGSPDSNRRGPSSPSDSLIGHASSETNSDQFLTPASSQSASSESSSSSSTPNHPLSEDDKRMFKEFCLRQFETRLHEIDPYGSIGPIKEPEILKALRFSEIQTFQELKDLSETLSRPKEHWPSFEETHRTSVYHRIWSLLEQHKRPDPFD